MNKTLKIKINGNNIKSLFLALYLADSNNDIYIYDQLEQNLSSQFEDKYYLITNSSKNVLEELGLWKGLQSKIYGFNSFSFINRSFKDELLFCNYDFYRNEKIFENIGWTLKHSNLEEILLKKLSNYKNIFFLKSSSSYLTQRRYDYEVHFGDLNNKFSKSFIKKFFKIYKNSSSIVFKAIIRNNLDGKAYQIFQGKETILMIPLAKNIYQIIWKGNPQKSKDRINTNENLLLDNLSALIPKELHLDQIVGDINFSPFYLPSLNKLRFCKNKIFFNEFNNISNHLITDELKSLFIDLDFLKRNLITNTKLHSRIFIKLKNYLKLKILYIISLSFFKRCLLEMVIKFKIFPDLLVNSQVLKFNRQNILRKIFVNSILKFIFLAFIK